MDLTNMSNPKNLELAVSQVQGTKNFDFAVSQIIYDWRILIRDYLQTRELTLKQK
jgi:hypothetical protein